MGLGDGSGILHQAVAGAPPVTRDGGAFGYVAAEDPPYPLRGRASRDRRPRRRGFEDAYADRLCSPGTR